jgi:uncharacterized membrane protein
VKMVKDTRSRFSSIGAICENSTSQAGYGAVIKALKHNSVFFLVSLDVMFIAAALNTMTVCGWPCSMFAYVFTV